MTEMTQAADTAAMRAEADQLNASVREDNRSLYERQRRAVQLAYEADLIDDAALCLAELTSARQRLPRLQQSADEAIRAERAAEDRYRAEDRKRARVAAEQAKADPADGDVQERIALRLHARQGAAGACMQEVSTARAARVAAERERDEWQAHVDVLEREAGAARQKAENPGTAPASPGLAPGVSRLSDMDQETRDLLTAAVLLAAALPGGSGPQQAAGPDRSVRTTNGELAAQDPSGFRLVRQGMHTFAIPPAQGR